MLPMKVRSSFQTVLQLGLLAALCLMSCAENRPAESNNMNYEEALTLAQIEIGETDDQSEYVIVEKTAQERTFGWVFEYTTRKYIQTGDPNDTKPGLGPLIVDRNGKTHHLPTSMPPAEAIQQAEENWNTHGQME